MHMLWKFHWPLIILHKLIMQSRFQVNKIYEWVDITGKEYMNG